MNEDARIVNEIIAGSVHQYRILVERYQNPVFRVVLKIAGNFEDAKEITQDVFVKTYESLNQYNANFRFFSWIYRIAINSALMYVKQQKRFSSIADVRAIELRTVEDNVNLEARERLLNHSINALPEKYRTVVLLKYFAGNSYSEIAEITGIAEKKVKSRLFDARKMLKERLEKTAFFSSEE
jgi:RNA polymerase sigma-70 factor (ECF subfamily)